ncbi:TetR family transcriptional regulator [Photobacterium aquimaris]|uniref:TetR/AcrR family transcriptional regulator n=1 Tax=Photobacterium aquimaris TaxID=512643 RepID=A0A2T3IT71_9GAMM|nr:TetR family transcriptional regulator [Photobacterium aquimaris]OBU18429.1 TetR family transcriptional regulator [Photobacterium aquimaris]OBU20849.1 TetR family transcriptional regulator [Photobacterium aquimaris]PSU31554.1 TetR/AcrR family transcriptional regulator [Photobacterium aquimaris]PSW03238.1 TetR/AcrR family transcriptional regulator [Photobacterium aquimaris]
MSNELNKRASGRPNIDINARQLLIVHARELFSVMAYDKVSTRMIAQKSGVNVAMIRYYFNSKEGLFEAMVRETLAPIQILIQQLLVEKNTTSLFDLMRTYYRVMTLNPAFPRLIFQLMYLPNTNNQRIAMEKIFSEITQPLQHQIFEPLAQQGVIRADLDPRLCKISFMSLMVFPFIAPPSILNIQGVEVNEDFFVRLLEHNIKVITGGLLLPIEEPL